MEAIISAIIVGLVVSIVAGIILHRWSKGDKHTIDLTKLEGRLDKEENERKLEIRRLEQRIDGHDTVVELLRTRYHWIRERLMKCLWKLGLKADEPEDKG